MTRSLFPLFCNRWIISTAITITVFLTVGFGWNIFVALELKTYDFRAKLHQKLSASPIVLIDIDNKSINELGEWPFPRDTIAEMLSILASYGAKTTGIDIIFSKEAKSQASEELDTIIKDLRESLKGKKRNKDKKTIILTKAIISKLITAQKNLDIDAALSDTIHSLPRTILPMEFALSSKTDPSEPLSKKIIKRWGSAGVELPFPYGTSARGTIRKISRKARAIGHNNRLEDPDGKIRREYLLIPYEVNYYPSFSLQVASAYKDEPLKTISNIESIKTRFGLKIGELEIPTTEDFSMFISYADKKSFPRHSFSDVFNKKVPAEAFKDRIVLIGLNITGQNRLSTSGAREKASPSFITASAIENILNKNHISRPQWVFPVEAGIMIFFGLFLAFISHRLSLRASIISLITMLVIWNALAIFLFIEIGIWISMFYPSFILLFGYPFISIIRRLILNQEAMDKESIESNKLLALSFQSQGMLDMAFDKLKKCPAKNPAIKEHLYNLGLDFERKRMLNKAVVVYEHILKTGKFKDVKERIKQLKDADGQVVLSKQGAGADKTVLISGAPTLPTLGRYEIVKELGQGAMGTVYLGKDPKINREVAIKTLRYEELDEDTIDEVKTRFFREAEAAGNLSHPNIVTIYDVGEDGEIAYMAMELLEGNDLEHHMQKKKKMDLKEKISIVSAVAEGLDYAHKKGVVHRDIKPANIMMLKDDTIKVADFGIARVMSSSKTQTGMVLGTPSYMSPEQISGKKVDGRSDLFSLGIVLYELITGERPFTGDSFANLMYNIANTTYKPAKELSPKTPKQILAILEKSLSKGLSKRYQSGNDLAKDLNKAVKELGL